MTVNTLINSVKINANWANGCWKLIYSRLRFLISGLKINASDFSLISHCIPGNFSYRILSNRFRAYEGRASNQSANNRPVDRFRSQAHSAGRSQPGPGVTVDWLECCCVDQGKGLAFVSFTLVHDKVFYPHEEKWSGIMPHGVRALVRL